MDRSKSLEMQQRARQRIPGGTQLLSKRPEMFAPSQWPGYYSRAKGTEVWDLDGNKYIDMSIFGIGANVLGFADPDVDKAVIDAINNGNSCSFNCPEEIDLAELLCELHPWTEMVRYARTGGESMAIAVRIARAFTKKDTVAFCGYHGWSDWYLSANLGKGDELDGHLLPGLDPAGVPRNLAGTALPFRYNQIEELKAIVDQHKGELAAIIMEPVRSQNPYPGFLEEVREIADTIGAVLIFDEISSGFRLNTGGAHLVYRVNPDIAVFSKAISNGYPMGAIIGRGQVMQAAQTSFISSTNWTERIGPVAAIATILKHKRNNVGQHLIEIGELIQEGWRDAAMKTGLGIEISGIPPLSHFAFKTADNLALMTLFTQLMLDRGFLASSSFYASFAHTVEHVKLYIRETQEVFSSIADGTEKDSIEQMLKGPVAHSGFRRLA